MLDAPERVQAALLVALVQRSSFSGVGGFVEGILAGTSLRSVVSKLFRRSPPLASADLISLLKGARESTVLPSSLPLASIAAYLERAAQSAPLPAEALFEISQWAEQLSRGSQSAESRKTGARLRALVGFEPAQVVAPEEPAESIAPATQEEADEARRLLANLDREMPESLYEGLPARPTLSDVYAAKRRSQIENYEPGRAILEAPPRVKAAVVLALLDGTMTRDYLPTLVCFNSGLQAETLPYTPMDIVRLIESVMAGLHGGGWNPGLEMLWKILENHVGSHGVAKDVGTALLRLRDSLAAACYHPPYREYAAKVNPLLGIDRPGMMEPGEPWADAALADFDCLDETVRPPWTRLFAHALSLDSSKPGKAWTKQADALLTEVGKDVFWQHASEWFPLVSRSRTVVLDKNSTVLRGLVWLSSIVPDAGVPDALSRLALACFTKIIGCGQRCAKAGNACVAVLGNAPGVGGVSLLNRLRQKVTYQVPLRLIEKALDEAALRADLTREDMIEISVPTHGVTAAGRREEEFSDCTAILDVDGTSHTAWRWVDSNRESLEGPTFRAASEHAREIKDLEKEPAEIRQVLLDQKVRLEGLFLLGRFWPLPAWTERYVDHPLVGLLARRLIWDARIDSTSVSFMPDGAGFIDIAGRSVTLPDQTIVTLWHPTGRPRDEIAGWCDLISARRIVQPFKQAWRETYEITRSEVSVGDKSLESDRFAGHILRQHQFRALCLERGWRYRLQGGWDSANTPYLEIPRWGMVATFDVGNDDDVEQTASNIDKTVTSGAVGFGRTIDGSHPDVVRMVEFGEQSGLLRGRMVDRVQKELSRRFVEYRTRPMALVDIPPIIFSEVMRDIDLFVSACSIGNSPVGTAFQSNPTVFEYWKQFSFGEPTGTVQSRHTLIERLLPTLPIAAQCILENRYLAVQGRLRRYRIHLGSGNVFMEPGSVAIVLPKPGARERAIIPSGERLYVPFEGDELLFDILNNAMILVRDDEITDKAFRKQIRWVP